jgi:uncharacterized protein (TIGR00369 family)
MPEPVQNPEFAQVVHESFLRQKFMTAIGAKLIRVEPGQVEIELPFSDAICQQSGVVHAGVLASIADSACGYAALTLMPAGSDVVSVEFKLNLLAPAAGERFLARARVIRAGRTLTVCSADVIAAPSQTVVATMLGTMMRR